MLVVLDPGHGGRDPGAIGPTGLREKDVNLKIALYASQWLRNSNVDVLMTRTEDVDVSLADRCAIANRAGADCFVSVHCNAFQDPNVRGTEVYYYYGSQRGRRLAESLLKEVVALGFRNRGVKEAGFYVLKNTAMPAALVEVAFISNPNEEAWLANPTNQEITGKAIAKGICNYLSVPFKEKVPLPGEGGGEPFRFQDSAGSSGTFKLGGTVPDWIREQEEALEELAVVARFNMPHRIDEDVKLGFLAVVLKRMGVLDFFKKQGG
jgi:N-acetylmuramoyl-L-alanine amidase